MSSITQPLSYVHKYIIFWTETRRVGCSAHAAFPIKNIVIFLYSLIRILHFDGMHECTVDLENILNLFILLLYINENDACIQ